MKKHPVVILHCCKTNQTDYVEIGGDSIEEIYRDVGEFVLKNFTKLEDLSRKLGNYPPCVHIQPATITKEELNKLFTEVSTSHINQLIADAERGIGPGTSDPLA